MSRIWKAFKSNDMITVKKLLSSRFFPPDIHALNYDKKSVLQWAAQNNRLQLVGLLLDMGIKINEQNRYDDYTTNKFTALHFAAQKGHKQIVELLIRRGADVNSKTYVDNTSLRLALSNGHHEIAKILIRNGANVNIKNHFNTTPLHITLRNKQNKNAGLLINAGAELSTQDWEGETPLHIALKNDLTDISEILIKKGADPNAQDNKGITPLHLAVSRQQLKIIQLLIDNGANVNAKDNEGETPLFYTSDIEICELLILNRANINVRNKQGKSVLQQTMEYKRDKKVELLKSKGADKRNKKKSIVYYTNPYGWMNENLNVGNFRKGDLIPQAKTAEEWLYYGENGLLAWCYINSDPRAEAHFGKLYNWFAVNDERNLAPEGFHIPSEKEWSTTIETSNNESFGFTEFYGGYRYDTGKFEQPGKFALYWCSDACDVYTAHSYFRINPKSKISWAINYKQYGLYVRCIEDK